LAGAVEVLLSQHPIQEVVQADPGRLSRSRTKRNVLLEIRRLDFTACIHQPGSKVRASSPVDRRRDAPRARPSSNTPTAWLLLRGFDRKAVRRELQDLLTDWQGPLEGEPRRARGANSFTAARGSLKRPPEVGKRPESEQVHTQERLNARHDPHPPRRSQHVLEGLEPRHPGPTFAPANLKG